MERFSASNAAQFMACPASANLDLAIPGWIPPVRDPTKGAKGKGSIIHEILALAGQFGSADFARIVAAADYVAKIRSRRRFKVLIEEKQTAHWLQSKPFTTPDVVLYLKDELHIIDYKTGKIPVYAENNKQLLFLAATNAPLAPNATGVYLHIVQPWCKDVMTDMWWASTAELQRFIADAQAAEQLILQGDTTFHPSDNCTFCPANPHTRGDKGTPLCPAMLEMLYPDKTDYDELLKEDE